MKKKLLLLFTAFTLFSCKQEKKSIEFNKLANLDLGNLSKENAKARGLAVFFNHSEESYTLKDVVLDLTIDGKDVGTIVSKSGKSIHPRSEFSIPFQYTYSTAPFAEEGHDPASSYAVQFIGTITVKDKDGNLIEKPVKFAETYEYLTKKEKKKETREERKEERRKRREERKAQ